MGRGGLSVSVLSGLLIVAGAVRGQEDPGPGVGYALGDPNAPVTVVEFADFACTACGQFWRDTWPRVRSELVETGRVSWRHVPFVLGFRHGDKATRAAECAADQDAFWPMLDRIFGSQAEWMGERRPDDMLKALAADLVVDGDAYQDCYDKNRAKDRTRDANRAARKAGIRATPTFLVNGQPVLGALDYPSFLAVVEAAERAVSGQSPPIAR